MSSLPPGMSPVSVSPSLSIAIASCLYSFSLGTQKVHFLRSVSKASSVALATSLSLVDKEFFRFVDAGKRLMPFPYSGHAA